MKKCYGWIIEEKEVGEKLKKKRSLKRIVINERIRKDIGDDRLVMRDFNEKKVKIGIGSIGSIGIDEKMKEKEGRKNERIEKGK